MAIVLSFKTRGRKGKDEKKKTPSKKEDRKRGKKKKKNVEHERYFGDSENTKKELRSVLVFHKSNHE